ncbi:hypothetical protein AVEN_135346-1, partial [Araneus ventricosus]
HFSGCLDEANQQATLAQGTNPPNLPTLQNVHILEPFTSASLRRHVPVHRFFPCDQFMAIKLPDSDKMGRREENGGWAKWGSISD